MAIDVNDATLPLDNSLSSPASEGAGEFRALKAKINAMFLSTGIGVDYTKLITTNNEGLFFNISDGSLNDLYGSKSRVTRTASAATKNTHGFYSETILANGINVSSGQVNGISAVVQSGTNCIFSFIFGASVALYNQTHNNNASVFGVFVVFANRLTAGLAAPSGLGTNWYNRNATAMYIDSFPRSSAGEYCGWKTGIAFSPNSMDRDITAPGFCIDFSAINFIGGTDPLVAYRMKAAIKLNNYMGIIWDNTENIITYFDSTTGRLTFSNTGVKCFEFDMVTKIIYCNGVAVTVP